MKVLLILAHPEALSFNGSMYKAAQEILQQEGHEVKCTDLYSIAFDPRSNRHNFQSTFDSSFLKLGREEIYATENDGFVALIAEEHEKLAWCNVMIWQFPLWWFSVPAILKGWVDRVFSSGKIYGSGRIPYHSGKFKGKRALLSLTTGSSEAHYRPDGDYGDIHSILRHIHRGMLAYVGFSILSPEINYSVAHISFEERREILDRWGARLKNLFDENVIEIGKY